MKRAILIYTLLVFTLSVWCSDPCTSCTIYNGYIKGDMEMWKKGMEVLQEKYNSMPDGCNLYSLTEARYGYIGFLLGTEKKSVAKSIVDIFEQDIEKLAAYAEYQAETEAFRIALLGFRMGLNPAKAVSLGPKALKQLEKTMLIGNDSPAAWIEKGNSEAHMPSFAGGSKVKAAASFREALRLFEKHNASLDCNWRYLNTMVLLAQTLERTDDYMGAREAYMAALKKEPSFQWVRDELLPDLEKKMNVKEGK